MFRLSVCLGVQSQLLFFLSGSYKGHKRALYRKGVLYSKEEPGTRWGRCLLLPLSHAFSFPHPKSARGRRKGFECTTTLSYKGRCEILTIKIIYQETVYFSEELRKSKMR